MFGLWKKKEQAPDAVEIESQQPVQEQEKSRKLLWIIPLPEKKPRREEPPAEQEPEELPAPPVQQSGLVPAHTGKGFWYNVRTWAWTRSLLHWIILSAGTMSEFAFLLASLWVSVNANVHAFITQVLGVPEGMTQNITSLATTAYIALPECIVGLAMVITISHVRMVLYNRRHRVKDWWPGVWVVLYGGPTLVFLGLSLYTLGSAVANVTFEMPKELVVARALAGYIFAFTSLLYTQIGTPQEQDRLAEKDVSIARWQSETARLNAVLASETARLESLIAEQNEIILASKKRNEALANEVNKSAQSALDAYSVDCKNWLMSGVKTAFVETVSEFTGHSKRKINNAIAAGNLQVSPRNKELILVSSLIEWLKNNPPETAPKLRIVNS